jgi:formylglycine-generating enzyme required for sulfatase activity
MADDDTPEPISVFISYSHKDEALRQKLEAHIKALDRAGIATAWHDRQIAAGTEWQEEITRNLAEADIILLLISASFLASPFCWDEEMKKALDRHDRGLARVIPVILKPCHWQEAPFAKLQAVPREGKAVTKWSNRDEAFLDIVSGIRQAANALRLTAAPPKPARAAASARTDATAAAAGSDPQSPVEAGDPIVREAQMRLTSVGFSTGWADGFLGPRTRSAIEAFQREAGMPVDGVISSALLDRLRSTVRLGTGDGGPPRERVGVRVLKDLEVFRDGDAPWFPEMVVIPAGTFLMGSPPGEEGRKDNEGPQHKVTIGSRFALGKYAVTVGEYRKFVEVTGHRHEGGMYVWTGSKWKEDATKSWQDPGFAQGDRNPVVGVKWRDAVAYCEWLATATGKPYRLPSEAEWEYGARAGTTTPFSFGETISPAQANYNGNFTYGGGAKGEYRQNTVAVGSFPANAWGLYDLHGNVWEWVADVWHDSYQGAPADGSAWIEGEGTNSSRLRVGRGGSWGDNPRSLRSANRSWGGPGNRNDSLGFRVARTLD